MAAEPAESPPGEAGQLAPEEEPVFTGTLFLMLILLMLIFGFWVMMYVTLLNR
jgi:hypothetical protein